MTSRSSSSNAARRLWSRPSRASRLWTTASRFSKRMSGQIPGSPAAILSCRENSGRELQQDGVLLGDLAGLVHQGAGQQVRDVAGDGDQSVVVLALTATTLAPISRKMPCSVL